MVDVGDKAADGRAGRAPAPSCGCRPETAARVVAGDMPKGDVLAVARIAAIQAAKRTAELRAAGRPFISALVHPTTGGVAASFAALGDVIIAEPGGAPVRSRVCAR